MPQIPAWVTDVGVWLKGLVAAVIGGISTSAITMVADPASFNLHDGADRLKTVALASGFVAAANYLKTAPLPGMGPQPGVLRSVLALFVLTSLLAGLHACSTSKGSVPVDYEQLGEVGVAALCYELPDADRQAAASFIDAASQMEDDSIGVLLQNESLIKGPAARAVGAVWFGLTEFAKGEPTGEQYWRDYGAASRRMLNACARGLRRAGTVVGAGAA